MGALCQRRGGFTLIEMSIVLVIIGLIVGGVLVGQSLIAAAGIRATITQIEKYNQAANTFTGKYGYLPGDIKDPGASMFGFLPRGSQPGQGNGDGVIAGFWSPASLTYGSVQTGEPTTFWVLYYWQDEFIDDERRRRKKRHKLAPGTTPEREVRKIGAEFLRPVNQGLVPLGSATGFTEYVDGTYNRDCNCSHLQNLLFANVHKCATNVQSRISREQGI